jgi:hypothetical protein
MGIREGRFPNIAMATRHYGCNYNVICTRAKGIQGIWLKEGKNKRLNNKEEATLV